MNCEHAYVSRSQNLLCPNCKKPGELAPKKHRPRYRPPKRKVEKWKHVEGFDGLYSISNFGKVRANARIGGNIRRIKRKKRIIKTRVSRNVCYIGLTDYNANSLTFALKDLVADHWLKPRTGKKITLKDKSDPSNCSVYNLMEVGNTRYRNAKLTFVEVKEIKEILFSEWRRRGIRSRLAEKYEVSNSLITLISNGERWNSIKPKLPPENT